MERGEAALLEQLFSRQTLAIGPAAQQLVRQGKVLVYGLNPLGAEVAKNLVLAGVKDLFLVDDELVEEREVASHPLLQPFQVALPRSTACAQRLRRLCYSFVTDNEQAPDPGLETDRVTRVTAMSLSNVGALVKETGVSVVVDASQEYDEESHIQMNAECRNSGAAYVMAATFGVMGRVFVDFGQFEAERPRMDDAIPRLCMVEAITPDSPALVTLVDEQKHGLCRGDKVRFIHQSEEASDELFDVVPVSQQSFLADCSSTHRPTCEPGSYIQRVPKAEAHGFAPLETQMREPALGSDSGIHPDRRRRWQLEHCLFSILSAFETGKLAVNSELEPTRWISILEVVSSALKDRFEVKREEDFELIKLFALSLAEMTSENLTDDEDVETPFEITAVPLHALVGALAAQETIKYLARSFEPLKQWLYLDVADCFGDDPLPRLASQTSLLEYAEHEWPSFERARLSPSSTFRWLRTARIVVAGAGALGSEIVRLLSLMNVACQGEGSLSIADGDVVTVCSLSQQMMYGQDALGSQRSSALARIATSSSPSMRVSSIGPLASTQLDRDFKTPIPFMPSTEVILCAMDSLNARLAIDGQCVQNGIPLVEGGIHGTMGSVSVSIPYRSAPYSLEQDPTPEGSVKALSCVINNFPYMGFHATLWAKEQFDSLFGTRPSRVNAYLENRQTYLKDVVSKLPDKTAIATCIGDALLTQRPTRVEDCVKWALWLFHQLFNVRIAKLLENFPVEKRNAEGGPFWSGCKKLPSPSTFDPSCPRHVTFVWAACNLQASLYGFQGVDDVGMLLAMVDSEESCPGGQAREEADEFEEVCEKLEARLAGEASLIGYRLKEHIFNPEISTNYHLVFVHAAAALRCAVYGIPSPSILEVLKVAGDVTPSLCTTVSLVAGFMVLETLKVRGVGSMSRGQWKRHRNHFLNTVRRVQSSLHLLRMLLS
eukprot:scaffold2750_cov380-Prasinococcus_capsulatus_cf.AAC.3